MDLPVRGRGSAVTDPEGREPQDALGNSSGLVELASSIGALGMLQPVLVEELPDGQHRLVAGERRLRAARLGGARQPDNQHFSHVPALVCKGPLSDAERRTWHVVENLARADLQPGQLAEALLYQRCDLMQERLLGVGVVVPEAVSAMEDPVVRLRALDQLRIRDSHHRVGAPWRDVLERLGIPMGEDTARRLVRAFAHLPEELSTEMDHQEVALATRLEYLQLCQRDGDEVGLAIWGAAKEVGHVELLRGAVHQCLQSPGLTPSEALSRAEQLRTRSAQTQSIEPETTGVTGEASASVGADVLAAANHAVRTLLADLRAGARLERHDGTLVQNWAEELLDLVTSGSWPEEIGASDTTSPQRDNSPQVTRHAPGVHQ